MVSTQKHTIKEERMASFQGSERCFCSAKSSNGAKCWVGIGYQTGGQVAHTSKTGHVADNPERNHGTSREVKSDSQVEIGYYGMWIPDAVKRALVLEGGFLIKAKVHTSGCMYTKDQ